MSITIKQAFQKLAMVTGAALKNPWFIGRNLNQAFAEIADNVEGGGDKVTVTQTLTEGTEIGSIKVNNDTTKLYAPKGGNSTHNYSTTEQVVGKWVDGTSDVYELVLTGLDIDLSNPSAAKTILSDLDAPYIVMDCIAFKNSGSGVSISNTAMPVSLICGFNGGTNKYQLSVKSFVNNQYNTGFTTFILHYMK